MVARYVCFIYNGKWIDHLNYFEVRAILLKGLLENLAIGGQMIKLDTTDFQKIDYASIMAALQAAAAVCNNKKGDNENDATYHVIARNH